MANRYLVTGGAGFIGSHLVRALLERGDQVRVLDNFATGRRSNLAGLDADIDLREASITDNDALQQAMQGIDFVLHQAAVPSVSRSIEYPGECHHINVTGTLNVLLAARDAAVRKVVFAASSAVYGDTPTLPKHEAMMPLPLSPYAVAKLTGEHYCRIFAQVYGVPTVALRYFNVFGPRQDPASIYSAVIPLFISKMVRGEAPIIYGDGLQSRDFTFVANVVQANLLACQAEAKAHGQVMNIACGQATALLDLVAMLNQLLGTQLKPVHKPARIGDVRHSMASIECASQLIGYNPKVNFEQGLRMTLDTLESAAMTP